MPVKLKKLLMITRLFYTTTHTPQRTIHRRQNTRRLQKRWRPSQIVSPDKDGSQLTGQSGTNCTVCLFDATTKKTLNKHLTSNGYLYFSRCGFNYLFLERLWTNKIESVKLQKRPRWEKSRRHQLGQKSATAKIINFNAVTCKLYLYRSCYKPAVPSMTFSMRPMHSMSTYFCPDTMKGTFKVRAITDRG